MDFTEALLMLISKRGGGLNQALGGTFLKGTPFSGWDSGKK
jgi:hypothetical protein